MTAPENSDREPGALTSPHALRNLELRVLRRLDGLLHGEHLGLRSGPGSEPGEARLYQPGEDDVRRMDWSVTARTTVPHVRDTVADRELETWTLLDLSPSMEFGTTNTRKRDLAIGALAAMHALTQRVGDRFGAHFLHRGRIRRWPAKSGKAPLFAMLATATRAPDGTDDAGSGQGLADALDDLARVRRRRGLRIVLSDFLDPAGGATTPDTTHSWERPLRSLASRHQALAIEILDPRELHLPALGWVTMRDPETGRTREVHLSADVQRRYAAAAAAQREAIRAGMRRCGVPHLVLRTDRDWVRDIARFVLHQRRTAGQLSQHTPVVPR